VDGKNEGRKGKGKEGRKTRRKEGRKLSIVFARSACHPYSYALQRMH
jgi:hypothetical protein